MNDHERASHDEGGEAPCFAHLLEDEPDDELPREQADLATPDDHPPPT